MIFRKNCFILHRAISVASEVGNARKKDTHFIAKDSPASLEPDIFEPETRGVF